MRGKRIDESVDQASDAAAHREEDRRVGIRRVRLALGAQAEQQRPGAPGGTVDLWGHGARAQPLGVAGVDPADERIHESLEHFATESVRHHRPERVIRRWPTGQQWLEGSPCHATGAQDARAGDRKELGGHAEHEPRRQSAELAPSPHVGAPDRGRDQVTAEPESPAQLDCFGHPGEERVGGLVDIESREARGADVPTEPIAGLEHRDPRACVGELERAREPGDAASDDDDVRHEVLCTSSTRRPSTAGSVSGSTP